MNEGKVGLCLSGGGYRAALFHLGALRRLNELGILSTVDTVFSVSGGSIIAAHLASRIQSGRNPGGPVMWPQRGEVISSEDWNRYIAAGFRSFTSRNIRSWPIAKRLAGGSRLWFYKNVAVKALEEEYRRHLTDMRLEDLPPRPHFVFRATDLIAGDIFEFRSDSVGLVGKANPIPDGWTVATAVAASSCFPPVFEPYDTRRDAGPDYQYLLTDGGVSDNMAVEWVWDPAPTGEVYTTIYVSNAGGIFQLRVADNIVSQVRRYNDVLGKQAQTLRLEGILRRFEQRADLRGAYWETTMPRLSKQSKVYAHLAEYEAKRLTYSAELAELIAKIRTDLDRFTDAEADILENHGYAQANAAIALSPGRLSRVDADFALPNPERYGLEPEAMPSVKDVIRQGRDRSFLKVLWGRACPMAARIISLLALGIVIVFGLVIGLVVLAALLVFVVLVQVVILGRAVATKERARG